MKEDFNRVVVFDFSKMTEADVEKAKTLISQVMPVMPGFNEVFEKGFKKKEIVLDDVIATLEDNGGEFTPEQFWNEEVKESLYNDPDKYINCEQYYKDKLRDFDIREFTSSDGLRFSMSEFC